MVTHKLADSIAYPPRAMRAPEAARYLAMSEANFFRLVEEGLMPQPVRIKGVVTWDRLALDLAYEAFKGDEAGGNTMHKILGIKT